MTSSSRRSADSSRTPRGEATNKRPWWRRWFKWLVLPGLVVGLLAAVTLFVLFVRVPLPEDVAPGATVVLDRHGEVVGTLAGDLTRDDVALTDVPEHVKFAVLAAEDRGFYSHEGVSPLGIARAVWVNVRAGEVRQGGSTITQ